VVWRNRSTCLKSIKRRMLDNYYQKWYSEINNSSKRKSIALFKHTFNRAHELAIETGRYTNTPQNERLCKNSVESEYHVLLVCPKYRELRTKYLKPYYCHWPYLNKFESLMCCNNKTTFYNISKFIYFAKKIRIS